MWLKPHYETCQTTRTRRDHTASAWSLLLFNKFCYPKTATFSKRSLVVPTVRSKVNFKSPNSKMCWNTWLASQRSESAIACLAAFSKLNNMETTSLPSKASWSLPALIWKMSLGLEESPYLKDISKPDGWFIFGLTLGTDPCYKDLC